MSKTEEYDLIYFHYQLDMLRLNKTSLEEDLSIADILFDFQRRPIIGFIANEFCRE